MLIAKRLPLAPVVRSHTWPLPLPSESSSVPAASTPTSASPTRRLRFALSCAHDVKLNVNPADFNLVKSLLPQLNHKWPALTHIELVEDSNVTRGGCRVYTEGGLIDADLQTQLDRIAADLIPED